MRDVNKFRGCLIGGAAGDALGYTVEFMREESIFSQSIPFQTAQHRSLTIRR